MSEDLAYAIVMAAQRLEQQEERRHICTISASKKYTGHQNKLRFKLSAGGNNGIDEEFRSFSQAYNRALDLGYSQSGKKKKGDDEMIEIINTVHADFEKSRQNFTERVLLLLTKTVKIRYESLSLQRGDIMGEEEEIVGEEKREIYWFSFLEELGGGILFWFWGWDSFGFVLYTRVPWMQYYTHLAINEKVQLWIEAWAVASFTFPMQDKLYWFRSV